MYLIFVQVEYLRRKRLGQPVCDLLLLVGGFGENEYLWQKVKAIPNVRLFADDHNQEINTFEAETAGQTFLFADDGKLLFSGGITPSRGHMGDSLGRDIILSWANGRTPEQRVSKVFGCALKNAEIQVRNDDEDSN